jgi:hypothetical protein
VAEIGDLLGFLWPDDDPGEQPCTPCGAVLFLTQQQQKQKQQQQHDSKFHADNATFETLKECWTVRDRFAS